MKMLIKKIRDFQMQRRRNLFKKRVVKNALEYQEPLKVNGLSVVNSFTKLGKNVNFNGMKIKGAGKVTIGDNFHSGEDCVILTSFHQYDNGDSIPYDSSKSIHKDVTIEDNVWFGEKVMVLGGVKIGEGAIIQAGSVVVNNVPKCAIVGGHPAKIFKYRDIEHYDKLKKQKKFH